MGLAEGDVDPDPFVQFGRWYEEAVNANLIEPSAMTLATASRSGTPSARMVLLKGFDERGFAFFTNYDSPKARDLTQNPLAALVFWWGALQRQVRIAGPVTRVPEPESDAYFESRPLGSRIGAVASKQSSVLATREDLERRVLEVTNQYRSGAVPRPAYWGGYRLAPNTVEFWQGRPDRLHDRLLYSRVGASWKIERLSP
jgi:pyridoxamine 5'-phosphate oxidase